MRLLCEVGWYTLFTWLCWGPLGLHTLFGGSNLTLGQYVAIGFIFASIDWLFCHVGRGWKTYAEMVEERKRKK